MNVWNTEEEQRRIWGHMNHCVEKCLLDNFKNSSEMLSRYNWCVVLRLCIHIIQKEMISLKVVNPFIISSTVTQHAMESDLDRDPKWRCICSFFVAAAIEINVMKKLEEKEELLRKEQRGDNVEIPTAIPVDRGGGSKDELIKELMRQIRELKDVHDMTSNKVSQIHDKLHRPSSDRKHTKVTIHAVPAENAEEMFKKVMRWIKGEGPPDKPDESI